MIRRIILIWAAANFGFVGLASLIAGGWYLGWRLPAFAVIWVELGLLMLPNLVLSVAAARFGWISSPKDIQTGLGWRWQGWRSLGVGITAFGLMVLLTWLVSEWVGGSIPYNAPGAAQANGGVAIRSGRDLVIVLGMLLSLLFFVLLTVSGEESMFRGLIQTQVGGRYGAWAGLLLGALLFGLRHLPNDLFYGGLWQAGPRMWFSRQLQLYLGALILGLARHFGRSTAAPAIAHGLFLLAALFG